MDKLQKLDLIPKWTLKRIVSILSTLLIIVVMVMSGIGMLAASTEWNDTMYTCIWCLSIVMITDRVEKI